MQPGGGKRSDGTQRLLAGDAGADGPRNAAGWPFDYQLDCSVACSAHPHPYSCPPKAGLAGSRLAARSARTTRVQSARAGVRVMAAGSNYQWLNK